MLRAEFKNINVERESFTYLGMKIQDHQDGIQVSMDGYTCDCIEIMAKHMSGREYVQPATKDLFDEEEYPKPLDAKSSADFRSIVARLIFLAKRVRPDILTAVTHLSSRVTKATERDWDHLMHLGGYLKGTRHYCINFSRYSDVVLTAYVDASFGVHEDYKSRSGAIFCLAGGYICAISKKQDLNVKSSTEAEIVALSDAQVYVIWLREMLECMGYKQPPTVIYEDNKSALTILEEPYNHRKETRHINTRYFFIKDRVKNNEVKLLHISTDNMLADMFTKPLDGHRIRHLADQFMRT